MAQLKDFSSLVKTPSQTRGRVLMSSSVTKLLTTAVFEVGHRDRILAGYTYIDCFISSIMGYKKRRRRFFSGMRSRVRCSGILGKVQD